MNLNRELIEKMIFSGNETRHFLGRNREFCHDYVIPFNSEVLLSPQTRGLRSESCSFMLISNPSMVVNLPPNVPAPTSKSSSGILREQVSDFSTSRDMSIGSVTLSVILVPFSDIPDPDLTSLVRLPQLSQFVAMIITSLKKGMAKKTNKLVSSGNLRQRQESNQSQSWQMNGFFKSKIFHKTTA